MTKDYFKAVDFFCGAGGMTNGFNKAGVKVLGGIDIDSECEKTFSVNNPSSKFVKADVKTMSYTTLVKELGIRKNDDKMIFIGCSPCQYWSKIKTDKTDLLNANHKTLPVYTDNSKENIKLFTVSFIGELTEGSYQTCCKLFIDEFVRKKKTT